MTENGQVKITANSAAKCGTYKFNVQTTATDGTNPVVDTTNFTVKILCKKVPEVTTDPVVTDPVVPVVEPVAPVIEPVTPIAVEVPVITEPVIEVPTLDNPIAVQEVPTIEPIMELPTVAEPEVIQTIPVETITPPVVEPIDNGQSMAVDFADIVPPEVVASAELILDV